MMIRSWRDLPKNPILPHGACHLWLARLDEECQDALEGFLSEDERLRARRLRNPQSADRFIVGRGILRVLLGSYLVSEPEKLVFHYGPHGKPELAGGIPSFNVSHSGSLIIIAVSIGFNVGVDIEEIHPFSDLSATASIFLSPDESAELEGLPADRKLEHFYTLWTCKEALLKAHGVGLSGPMRNILTTIRRPNSKGERQNGFIKNKRLTLLEPAQGFKGALACL
ncbi:MAG: 4'-phosphopantetheinyl transferase superfamily protein [Anaerolineaceae bacterium]|nr:4'-phosphopantetheinyl transferase superfamily protein [Anaerolineaceae bacterium]